MKLFSFLCLLGIFSAFFSCKSRDYTPETYEDLKITFGSGGGFTGLYTHYALLKNGQLFEKGPKAESFTAINKISKKEASAFFDQMSELFTNEVTRNTPGNMNFYLKMEGNDEPYELQWAAGQEDVDQAILDLYQSLMNMAQTDPVR